MKTPKSFQIKAPSDVMPFGKYKGQTIERILCENPGYIVWLEEEDVCEVEQEIYNDAQVRDLDQSSARLGFNIWDLIGDDD